jgi:hypothetical protein
MGSRKLDKLPENVKSELTKDKLTALENAGKEAFKSAHGEDAAAAATYSGKVEAKYKELLESTKDAAGKTDKTKVTEKLTEFTKANPTEAHFGGSVAEYVKHAEKTSLDDAAKKAIHDAGRKAHVDAHLAAGDKTMLETIKTQITDAATKNGGKAPEAEALTKAAEKSLSTSKDFARGGTFGKISAGFRGMGTGGKIATGLLAVGVAAGLGMAISSMRGGGSNVERLQNERANGAATAPSR